MLCASLLAEYVLCASLLAEYVLCASLLKLVLPCEYNLSVACASLLVYFGAFASQQSLLLHTLLIEYVAEGHVNIICLF